MTSKEMLMWMKLTNVIFREKCLIARTISLNSIIRWVGCGWNVLCCNQLCICLIINELEFGWNGWNRFLPITSENVFLSFIRHFE